MKCDQDLESNGPSHTSKRGMTSGMGLLCSSSNRYLKSPREGISETFASDTTCHTIRPRAHQGTSQGPCVFYKNTKNHPVEKRYKFIK